MRWFAAAVLLMIGTSALAQSSRYGDVSYHQPQGCSIITEQNKLNPYAYLFRDHCERVNAISKQSTARILGRPQPSRRVLTVPAHGSDEAKRLGVACMGGLVMLHIKNGWEQALDDDHRYYTCRL